MDAFFSPHCRLVDVLQKKSPCWKDLGTRQNQNNPLHRSRGANSILDNVAAKTTLQGKHANLSRSNLQTRIRELKHIRCSQRKMKLGNCSGALRRLKIQIRTWPINTGPLSLLTLLNWELKAINVLNSSLYPLRYSGSQWKRGPISMLSLWCHTFKGPISYILECLHIF